MPGKLHMSVEVSNVKHAKSTILAHFHDMGKKSPQLKIPGGTQIVIGGDEIPEIFARVASSTVQKLPASPSMAQC